MIMYRYLSRVKGLRLYDENAWITVDVFLPMISTDTVKKFYAVALHDTLRSFAGVQFTLLLTAEGNVRAER